MEKNCPLCNKAFECAENESCWCFKIDVEKQALEGMRKKCQDCVCKECLLSANIRNDCVDAKDL